jgi:inner membrane protein involved in colicin E2 resistance
VQHAPFALAYIGVSVLLQREGVVKLIVYIRGERGACEVHHVDVLLVVVKFKILDSLDMAILHGTKWSIMCVLCCRMSMISGSNVHNTGLNVQYVWEPCEHTIT